MQCFVLYHPLLLWLLHVPHLVPQAPLPFPLLQRSLKAPEAFTRFNLFHLRVFKQLNTAGSALLGLGEVYA